MSLVPLWIAGLSRTRWSRPIIRTFARRISSGCAIKIRCRGTAAAKPGTLYVANHISWADIPVLLAVLDAQFVARGDMVGWPVVGTLARRAGTLFVDRESRQVSGRQVGSLKAALEEGRSIILFAEGTTSDGSAILPFKPALLMAAQFASCVQPVVVRYCNPDGRSVSPQRQREIAWIGDDTLVEGIFRVAGKRTLAQVEFLEPVLPIDSFDRKALAARLHARMSEAYAALPSLSR